MGRRVDTVFVVDSLWVYCFLLFEFVFTSGYTGLIDLGRSRGSSGGGGDRVALFLAFVGSLDNSFRVRSNSSDFLSEFMTSLLVTIDLATGSSS